MVLSVLIATTYHLTINGPNLMTNSNAALIELPTKTLGHFSLLTNVRELITFKKGQHELNAIDFVKIPFILMGVVGHSVACLETPYGFYVMRKCYI